MFNLTSKKNMKKVLLVCVCTAMLASCGQNSADYKKLKAENDSLRIENTKNTDELNDMLSTLMILNLIFNLYVMPRII